MRLIVVKDRKAMGKRAAKIIADDMKGKSKYVLGLATGSTPETLYDELARLNKKKKLSFANVTTFNLDEYVGLDPNHDQSYRYFMNEKLFDRVDIDKANTYVPDGLADDPDAFGVEYEKMIQEAGGIDYQVLGIGSNGHIGFNEPGSSIGSITRLVPLTASTIKDNSRNFDSIDDVPTEAITMGIGTILATKKVILLAYGKGKAKAIAAALQGPVSAACPASALQLHPNATFVVTEKSAGMLTTPYGSYFETSEKDD